MEKGGKKQVDLIRLAEEQGVKLGKSQVSQYVSGKTVPRADILRFLADALDVEADWLGGREPADVQDAFQEKNDAPERDAPVRKNDSTVGGENMQKLREFKKSTKLDNVLYDVRGPVVDEAARMEEAGMQILKLNIGNPAPFGFRTPDEVIYDMRQQLTECEGYSDGERAVFRQKGDHAVCAAERDSERLHRGYLYGKRRQRTYQSVYVRPFKRWG